MEFPNGSLLGSGVDGWIRRNNGTGTMTIRSDGGNPYLSGWHSSGGTFVVGCQRIGSLLTNGMLQARIDMKAPDKWYWTAARAVRMYIGDDDLYKGEKNHAEVGSYNEHSAAGFGLRGENNKDGIWIFIDDGNRANVVNYVMGSVQLQPKKWYRFIVTVDIDSESFTVDAYELGDEHAASTVIAETPVESLSGGFRRKLGNNKLTELQGISAIALGTYGTAGGVGGTNNVDATGGFDNIVLTATLPEEDPVEIYRNDFAMRFYTNINGVACFTPLVGSVDIIDDGQDDWVRRNNGIQPAYIHNDDGNPHLQFRHTGSDHTYCMQTLGTDVSHNILCAQVDMRPPTYWVWGHHSLQLRLGDDRFWQGNRNNDPTTAFGSYYAMAFGFNSSTTSAGTWGVYQNVSAYGTEGDGVGNSTDVLSDVTIDASHWYRFQAEIVLSANTYSLKVYDMGSSHPTLETPTPSVPVAEIGGLRFRRNMQGVGEPLENLEALSSFALAAFGVRGTDLYPPEERALVDNLLFSIKQTGTLMLLQ